MRTTNNQGTMAIKRQTKNKSNQSPINENTESKTLQKFRIIPLKNFNDIKEETSMQQGNEKIYKNNKKLNRWTKLEFQKSRNSERNPIGNHGAEEHTCKLKTSVENVMDQI